MSRNPFRTILFSLSCIAATLTPSALLAQLAYAVTATNQLVSFTLSAPATFMSRVPITGLGGGELVMALDFRPATGELYAIGTLNRLYVLNPTTGAATQVGASGAFTLAGVGSGTSIGFDFNPTVDRIRVTTTAEENVRLNPATGALAATDTPLAYAIGDVNQGANPAIVASAYTNNVAGATTTALYGIDADLDVLVLQNPPNNGTLTTVGPLGFNAVSTLAGFDIVSIGGVNVAYAVLQEGSFVLPSRLYRIDLTTGAATFVGNAADILGALAIVPAAPRLANVSTRGLVLSGDNVLIGGFIIQGQGPQAVLVRARGPSLSQFGVPNVLSNPQVQLFSGQTPLAFNDNWGDAPNATAITASCFAPPNANEAAILTTLPPGGYTAIVTGAGGSTGIAIVEVFGVENMGGVCAF
jgi:hypothetical protein